MKTKLHLGRGAAILACAASLAGTAAVVAPTAASAARRCRPAPTRPSRSQPKEASRLPAAGEGDHVEGGVSCAEAYKVIAARPSRASRPPAGSRSRGNFEAPEGIVPTGLKKGSKKIKFATQGG